MNTSHDAEETEILIQERVCAEETKIVIQERVRATNERLVADFSKNGTKIHRFPHGLRRIGEDANYIVPSVAALGPYHHGSAHLQQMEEVKHAAAQYLCAKSGHSVGDVYSNIVLVADEARGCYADDAVASFSAAEFAAMMFLDGCFLLHYMTLDGESDLLVNRSFVSTGPSMMRDIFLLENQLPWSVLDALMTFTNISPVYAFVAGRASSSLNATLTSNKRLSEDEFQRYRPPHLLALLRYYLVGSMPPADPSYQLTVHYALASSAVELAEMGVKLTASAKTWFADMSVRKGPLAGGELSLTPLFLNYYTSSWLVNMAAFEACTSSTFYQSDGLTINSYISLLSMLVDKEEDVQELRAKHLLHSNSFTNQEILGIFKGLVRHVKLGYRYLVVVAKIEEYKRERRAQIVVHKFFYHNFKTIVAFLSIAGVLVGIFRALMGLKVRAGS